ncbi:unnamed protein product [Effrenium voratum]|uniref:Uncharacterized protein n=1 Tax=Effrenium voratum TaxID=2562239 RepID=A0AA36HL00_9DINO|nr:unnamed protein product [Effrenium voratum]
MAWRPRCGSKGPRRHAQREEGIRHAQREEGRREARRAPQTEAKKKAKPCSGGRSSETRSSAEIQLRRLGEELAAEGQRFRQRGKECMEMAMRAEALHLEVRLRQHAREREAKQRSPTGTRQACRPTLQTRRGGASPERKMTSEKQCKR